MEPIKSFLEHPISSLANNRLVNLIANNLDVPDDLSALTSIAPGEVSPRSAGMTLKGVQAIWHQVEELYRSGMSPGVGFCLRKRGKVVLNRTLGHASGNGPGDKGEQPVLLTPDTPICQFSASKAVTAMLVHLLAEQGKINLLDPVSKYIPEFAAHGKQDTSIYHVLTHQSGFPNLPRQVNFADICDSQLMLREICQQQADYRGGNRQAYHALTGGVILGEIIQRASGMDIRDYIDKYVGKPLGMKHFNFGARSDDDIALIARNYATGVPLVFPATMLVKRVLGGAWEEVVNISNQPAFYRNAIPAGNLVATADDMSRFYQLLLNGGELDGVRIFHPDTVRRSIMDSGDLRIDANMLLPIRFSAGHMLGFSPVGMFGPKSQNAFGHLGFINTLCWSDPDREIAVSLQTTGKVLLGIHVLILAQLLNAINTHTAK